MATDDVDPIVPPPFLHLLSAFLAIEPTDSLISLARVCGGDLVAETVQRFIWDHCICKAVTAGKGHGPYVKKFLKKLIIELESTNGNVLDELYEQYACYMTSHKDDTLVKENSWLDKRISFLFPDDYGRVPRYLKSMKLVVPLQCSLNMLEGDTGCSVWPSGLFLAELILSFPEIFRNKTCFEVGSGVGLVGICLAHVEASKVILSDGDLSTLANMKHNLESNHLNVTSDMADRTTQNPNLVKCIYLPWESAPEHELQDLMPDIVLGADVIYDPLCLPHLIRVLIILLNRKNSVCDQAKDNSSSFPRERTYISEAESNGADDSNVADDITTDLDQIIPGAKSSCHTTKEHPVAYIASVIRNIDTFNNFLALSDQANLLVSDVTQNFQALDLLPYMQSYHKSSVRLFKISYLHN